jgi:hypothetical protein
MNTAKTTFVRRSIARILCPIVLNKFFIRQIKFH